MNVHAGRTCSPVVLALSSAHHRTTGATCVPVHRRLHRQPPGVPRHAHRLTASVCWPASAQNKDRLAERSPLGHVGECRADLVEWVGSGDCRADRARAHHRQQFLPLLTHVARKRLPKSRPSQTTSFTVGGAEGYMTSGSNPDDGLGEVFLKLGKQGSTLAGVMDAFSIAVSIGLQYGVPLET